jgi:hypothetical protein
MDQKTEALAELFRQTGGAHHEAFKSSNGDDPEWPIWYAEYLIDKLPAHLGAKLTKSHIVYIVMQLDFDQKAYAPGSDWARYYARSLMQRYG